VVEPWPAAMTAFSLRNSGSIGTEMDYLLPLVFISYLMKNHFKLALHRKFWIRLYMKF
jgi:hypothetical protein